MMQSRAESWFASHPVYPSIMSDRRRQCGLRFLCRAVNATLTLLSCHSVYSPMYSLLTLQCVILRRHSLSSWEFYCQIGTCQSVLPIFCDSVNTIVQLSCVILCCHFHLMNSIVKLLCVTLCCHFVNSILKIVPPFTQ